MRSGFSRAQVNLDMLLPLQPCNTATTIVIHYYYYHYNCYPLLLLPLQLLSTTTTLQLLPATTVIVTYYYYWRCKVREESFVRQRWKLTSVFLLLPLLLLLYHHQDLNKMHWNRPTKSTKSTNWATTPTEWHKEKPDNPNSNGIRTPDN